MNREELKQNNFYLWRGINIIIYVKKIWTDEKAYSTPEQVCTCIIEYNPLNKGMGKDHIYKIGDKVIIDNWKKDLKPLKYNKYTYNIVAGVFE